MAELSIESLWSDDRKSEWEEDQDKIAKRKRDYQRWQHGLFENAADRSKLNRMFGSVKRLTPEEKEKQKQLQEVREKRKAAPGRSQTILTRRDKPASTILG